MKIQLLFLLTLILTSNLYAQTNQNNQLINWFVGADIVGVSNSNEELAQDFGVREFEISAYSNIDHIWQGNLTLSLHKEPGSDEEAHPEIHEAFIYSNQLFERTNLKLGRFFLGFGRLNRFHRHDWILSYAPLYHEEFFGTEAVKDDGIEITHIFAFSSFFQLTAGITSGDEFKDEHDHDHEEDEEEEEETSSGAHVPTHYLRFSFFKKLDYQKGFEYGINYIGRTDNEGSAYNYAGVDFIFKDRENKFYKNLLQFEAWQRLQKEHEAASFQKDIGAYIYYERGFDQNHALGLRVDWYNPHTEDDHESGEDHSDDHGTEIDDEYNEVGLVYTYTSSEFMKMKLTLAHSNGLVIDEQEISNTKFMWQTIFMIGAHPAHLY